LVSSCRDWQEERSGRGDFEAHAVRDEALNHQLPIVDAGLDDVAQPVGVDVEGQEYAIGRHASAAGEGARRLLNEAVPALR
jgi:hypothetical protein